MSLGGKRQSKIKQNILGLGTAVQKRKAAKY